MIPRPSTSLALALSVFAASSLRLAAQSTPAPAPAPAPDNSQVVQLSPFEVSTSNDKGWTASTTLSGNRTQDQLADLPVNVYGMTKQFMSDLNLQSLQGAGGWVAGVTSWSVYAQRDDEGLITAYRGLSTGQDRTTLSSSRNYFTWFSPTDNYTIDRIDFNFGSNSLIYGNATPGGLPTTYTKVAQFRDFGEALASYSSEQSYRLQFDLNRAITDNLAVRINAVDRDNRGYIAFTEDSLRAINADVKYQPFAHTSIRAEFEGGLARRFRGVDEDAIQNNAAPGKGYNNNAWYYTSDNGGTIINASTSNSFGSTVAASDKTGSGGSSVPFMQGQNPVINFPGGVQRNFAGFNKNYNALGDDDWLFRPYHVQTFWVDQDIGNLHLDASYDRQRDTQSRNDSSFGGNGFGADGGSVVSIDGNGRPFEDKTTGNPKYYNQLSTTYRLSAAYSFNLWDWSKQYFVASAQSENDIFRTFRLNLANFAVENGGTNFPISSNKIIMRAYLDNPNIYGRGYWTMFNETPMNLPSNPTFTPGYYLSSDPNNPTYDDRYIKSLDVTESGSYFGGKLHSLFGVRTDNAWRKTNGQDQPLDGIGQAEYLGDPSTAPQSFKYDNEYRNHPTTYQGGLVYNIYTSVGSSLGVYADYSTSFLVQAFEKWDDQDLGPVTGQNREVGIKGDTLGHLLTYTVGFYRDYQRNASFGWSNPGGFTTTGINGTIGGAHQNDLQTLFNPVGLSTTDPSYFFVATGLNSEDHTTSANTKAKGLEIQLTLQRFHGFQAYVSAAYNRLYASRDFTQFISMLAAANARQAVYTSEGLPGYNGLPASGGGNLLALAQQIVTNNLGVNIVNGRNETPRQANGVLDYQFSPETVLNGVNVGAGIQWSGKYNFENNGLSTVTGDSEAPVSAYILYHRKIFNYPTEFSLHATNIIDAMQPFHSLRTIGVQNNPTATTAINYQQAYELPMEVTFTTDVFF
jgi:hypothetical protein